MANARELLKRKKSVSSTAKITRTMELVASAKMKKAQDAAAASRPYAEGLTNLVARLSGTGSEITHPLMEKREVKNVVVLVVTSDRGLCGAFNSNIVRDAMKCIGAHEAAGSKVTVIAVAKKAASTIRFFGGNVDATHSGIVDAPRYEQAQEIIEPIMEQYIAGDVDQVDIVYTRFETAARQYPASMTLLPAGSTDETNEEKKTEEDSTTGWASDFMYNPSPEQLLEALIPQTVRTTFFSTLLQTSAGEHAARRVAMKNATDAASDLAKLLNRIYNRARQTKITQEIAEIVGAVEAMA